MAGCIGRVGAGAGFQPPATQDAPQKLKATDWEGFPRCLCLKKSGADYGTAAFGGVPKRCVPGAVPARFGNPGRGSGMEAFLPTESDFYILVKTKKILFKS